MQGDLKSIDVDDEVEDIGLEEEQEGESSVNGKYVHS